MAEVPPGKRDHWTGNCDVTATINNPVNGFVTVDTVHTFNITNHDSDVKVAFEYKQEYWGKEPGKAEVRLWGDDVEVPADRSDRFDWAEDEEYDEEKLHRNSRNYGREDQWNFRCTGDVAVVEGGEYRVRYYTAVRPERAADYGSLQETKTECFRIVNNAVQKFDCP